MIENPRSSATAAGPPDLLAYIEGEIQRLTALIPDLEQRAQTAAEEQGDADVLRRHVLLHPERFSPHERDLIVEKAQKIGEARQLADVGAGAAREQLDFCLAVAASLRTFAANPAAAAVEEVVGAPAPSPAPSSALAVFQAVEAERLRIARDLHDGPAQVLADLVLKAEILDRIAQRSPDALPAELEEFRNLVRNAVGDLRRFMFDLRPDSLDDLGLVATMKRFSSEYQDRTGITCRFNVVGEERRVAAKLEEAVFRIIQEALNNVQKHSGASVAEVTYAVQPGRVMARIKDDGAGFDVAKAAFAEGAHLGLIGMRERAEALGGRVTVTSEVGKGSEVVVELPA